MSVPHGNSKKNPKKNHLYSIHDKEEDTTFKFGISGEELNEDGSSPRANYQVNLFNRVVGWFRFFAEVLISNIEGRNNALKMEQEHIDEYAKNNGKPPRGND